MREVDISPSVPPRPSSASLTHDRVFVPWTLSGPLLVAFRLPVYVYRLGLGSLLGHRFLLLTHRGRKSGRVYQTVLEVVHYDPRTHESTVLSGWGTRADWYRNIQARPPLEVQTDRERYVPVYRELSPQETYPLLVEYVRRLPAVARPVVRHLFARWGFSVEGPEEVQRVQAASLLMVAFRPQSPTGRVASQAGGRKVRYAEEPGDKRAYTRAVNESYTRWAPLYDVAVKLIPFWRWWLRPALAHLHGSRVLEVSFGTGDLLTRYGSRFEAHGVELNGRMVQIARRNLARSGTFAHGGSPSSPALPSRSPYSRRTRSATRCVTYSTPGCRSKPRCLVKQPSSCSSQTADRPTRDLRGRQVLVKLSCDIFSISILLKASLRLAPMACQRRGGSSDADTRKTLDDPRPR